MTEMNEQFPDELLSAYLDGETSPEERARIEARLQQSAETRDELDQLKQVSQLLQAMPPVSPGGEFTAAVMRRVERESLIPTVVPAAPPRASRRGWIVAAGGLAVAAAAVLLLLPVLFGPESGEELVQHEVDLHLDAPSGASAERSRPAVPALAMREPDSGSRVSEPEALSRRGRSRAAPERARSDPSSSSVASEAAPELVAGAPVRASGQAGREELKRMGTLANWNNVEIGDVVPYFQTSGDRAAVVKLTVVDVRKAAGTLQVLLARNSVLPVTDQEPSGAEHRGPSAPAEVQEEDFNGMLALYVESSDAQLISALEAIEADEQFVDFQLEPPVVLEGVELAATRQLRERENLALDSYGVETLGEVVTRNRMLRYQSVEQSTTRLQERRVDSSATTADRRERFTEDPGLAKTGPDAPEDARRPAALAGKADSQPSPAARAEVDESLLVQNAFQMLVNVPRDSSRFGESLQQMQRAKQPLPADSPADEAGPKRVSKQTAQTELPAVRVIFLFQNAEDHTQDG